MSRKRNRGLFDAERARIAGQKSGEARARASQRAGGGGVGLEEETGWRRAEGPADAPILDPETELRKLASTPGTAGYVRAGILKYLDAKERQKPEVAPVSRPARGLSLTSLIETAGASYGFELSDLTAAFKRGRSRRPDLGAKRE